MAEMINGQSIDEIKKTLNFVFKMMNGEKIPERSDMRELNALKGAKKFNMRVHCALLPWKTMEDIIK